MALAVKKREKCNARVHTQGTEIVKHTNEYLHTLHEQAVSCYETKIAIKRKAGDSQDTSHQIVGRVLLQYLRARLLSCPSWTA